jgi:alpha-glucoside transport system permease protein
LVYPAFETFRISLTGDVPLLDRAGQQLMTDAGQARETTGFVGLSNYGAIFASERFWFAIRNSVLWLMVVPTACIVFGMTIAVLADNVRWGQLAKSLIFVPLAISFVGAAVIWRNIFAAGGTEPYEVGLLNAALRVFSVEPRFWYETEFWGNFFMMWILVWIQTGFAMVIFSAALRSVPTETIEAARIDGASEARIFFKVILPQILGTVTVVWTTLVILVLKVFDIPYALTANKDDKLLLATFMEQTRTAQREDELAAAIAIILMITIIPIMVFNLWRMRRERND